MIEVKGTKKSKGKRQISKGKKFGVLLSLKTFAKSFCLLIFAFCLMIFWPSPNFWAAPRGAAVSGRIELINSKIKPRNDKIEMSGVVVWLDALDGAPVRSAGRQKKIITQRNKRFLPHVTVVEAGGQVDFPNEDPFFHNVFSIFNGKRFDLGLYPSGESRPVTFGRPGISYIFCNIHPQMSAVVASLETPYFAVSDPNGAFAIPGVPEGRYRLGVWHERATQDTLDALRREVQVSGNGLNLNVIQIGENGYLPRPHPNKHGQEYDHQQSRGYRKP
jgi:plastocyanin